MKSPPETLFSGRKEAWLVSLFTALLALGIGTGCLLPYYDSIDDPVMRLWIAGSMPHAAPSRFVVFINSYYAGFLTTLYRVWPGLSWYDLAFGALTFFSVLLYTRSFLLDGKRGERYPPAFLLGLLGIVVFTMVQFTLVSSYLACAGAVAGISTLFSASRRWRAGALLCLVLSSALAGMIRYESLIFMALFSAAAAAPLLFYAHWKRVTALFLAVVIALGLAWGVKRANDRDYAASPGWEQVQPMYDDIYSLGEYNPIFREYGYDDPQIHALFRNMSGWTNGDIYFFTNFFFSNSFFTPDRLHKARTAMSPLMEKAHRQFMRNTKWTELTLLYLNMLWPGFVLLLVAASYTMHPRSLLYWAYLCIVILAFCLVIDRYMKQMPPRVYFSLIPLSAALLLFSGEIWKTRAPLQETLFFRGFCLLALLGFGIWFSLPFAGNMTHNQVIRAALQRDLKDFVHRFAPDKNIFVVWNNHFPFSAWVIPYRAKTEPEGFSLDFLTGNASQTPLINARLPTYGLTNLEKDLCTKDNMLLIVLTPNGYPLFMKDHYGMDVVLEPVFDSGMFRVHRCVRQNAPPG